LNPLRAKLVNDLKELDKYLWTGHSALVGKRKNPLVPDVPLINAGEKNGKSLAEKTVEDVLLYFGETFKVGRGRYRQFVEKGIKHGRREDLQGGGLIRSSGGDKAGLLGLKEEDREKSDQRILGSGSFVSNVLRQANELKDRKEVYKVDLEELVARVAHNTGIEIEDLLSPKRERRISYARGIVCYLAVLKLGYELSEVGKVLGISSRKGVSRCMRRGEKSLDNDGKIMSYLA